MDDSPIPRCRFRYISLILIICLLISCGIFSFIINIDNSDGIVDGTSELILTFTKKHINKTRSLSIGEESGIISVECAIPAAKVNVVCSKCGKTTKVGYSVEKDEKVRICKKCGAKLK